MKSEMIRTLNQCPEWLLRNREASGRDGSDHIADSGKMLQHRSARLPTPVALDA